MTLNGVLILGILALTTTMSPCGGEDIVGECTVEGCGDLTWEKEFEGKETDVGIIDSPQRCSQY